MHKKSAFAALLLTLSILFISNEVPAQTTVSQDRLIYIESAELNTESFGKIVHALKGNSEIEVGEACVPAHIMSIRIKTNTVSSEKAAGEFKSRTNEILKTVSILENYNDEIFMSRCSAARYGRN